MGERDDDPPPRPPVLNYSRARVKLPEPRLTREQIDRRERVAAIWTLLSALLLPFVVIAWFFWRLVH
jgi:hypothetical protein